MFQQIWQRILNLWRQIQRRFRKQPAPPPPKPTPIRTFGEYEQKFMALLEGVAQGWSRGEIKGFLIGSKIKDAEWENWLQEFGERLLVSPETHLELGGRMVRLGEMNCGRISEVAGKIGRELLAGESLKRKDGDGSSISDNVPELLGRESLNSPIKNLSAANQGDSTSQLEFILESSRARPISEKVIELFLQGLKCHFSGDLSGAIAAFNKALEIEPKNSDVWDLLGATLNDLGRYSEAFAAFNKALKIDPKNSNVWEHLGATLNDLGRYSEAIAAFDKALEIHPKYHSAWDGRGIALNNLRRYSEAIAAYDKTLEITGDQYWYAWFNRGWAFFYSGRYIKAIQNWDEGLQKYLPSNHDYRLACGRLHQQKGEAHYKHGKQTFTYFEFFHKAKASYEQACEFLKSPLIPETYLEVMQGLITVCRSLGDAKTREYIAEATTVLETLLLDNQTHPEIKLRLQRKFAALYQLEVDMFVEAGDKVNALEKAESRKNFCLQWMRAASQNRIDSPTYSEIRELLANNTETAIIYWHLSPVSLTAFIITLDKFEVIATPITDIFAKRDSQSLEKWLENWKTNYQSYCETGKKPSKQQSKQPNKESHPWRQSMTAELPQLADILKIPQICTHLTNIQNLILIPHRDLHLLPLDALFLPPFCPDSVTDTDKPKIRRITRLPSAQIAIAQQQQNPTEIAPNSMLMVKNPKAGSGLKYPEIEAAAIGQFYQTNRPANTGTKTAIIQSLKTNSGIFHYTGHAQHQAEKSEDSALILGQGEELKLTEILQLNFANYYLVCLSACETGITKKGELIDEFVGLASGFLPETNYVISTLWRVDERSSALLTIYFYQLWNQGIEPPEALQQAKDWLRELTNGKLGEWYAGELLPLLRKAEFQNIFFFEREASRLQKKSAKIEEKPYEHPYHWAAFTITGNG